MRFLLKMLPRHVLVAAAGAPSPGRERESGRALARSYVRRLGVAGAHSDSDQYLALVGSGTSADARSSLRFSVDPRVVRAGIGRRFGLDDGWKPSRLRQLQRFEMNTYLPGDLLAKEDRATMVVGLEARVPLLDNEVVNVAAAAHDWQKISWRSGKLLLRQLAQRRLGGSRAGVRKRGFAVPLAALFQGVWQDEARDWFAATRSDLVDGAKAADLAAAGRSPSDLWALGVLVAWEDRLRCARVVGRSAFIA
jgi:hypothetical protein